MKWLQERFENKAIGSWLFSAGRLAAIESRFLREEDYEALLQIKSSEELRQRLTEHGYHGDSLARMLEEALKEDLIFLRESVPDAACGTALLLEADAHNLKLCLKSRLPGEGGMTIPELERLFHAPSLYGADSILAAIARAVAEKHAAGGNDSYSYSAVAQDDKKTVTDAWMLELIRRACAVWLDSRDIARVDLLVDRFLAEEEWKNALLLNNGWYLDWLRLDRDLRNLSVLRRGQKLGCSEAELRDQLLDEGTMAVERLWPLFRADAVALAGDLSPGRSACFNAFAEALSEWDKGSSAAAFSYFSDLIRLEKLREGAKSPEGAEKVLAWLFLRRFERMNLRLIERAVRGELANEQVRALLRVAKGGVRR